MHRLRPRRILGAFAWNMVSLTLRMDKALLPVHEKLRDMGRRFSLVHYGTEYEGSPDDIFIVTYPKSGTTWLQMIVHQLTTDGAMNFAHIEEVSPFLEESMIPRRRQISDLKATPRVVKSHLPYHEIPKGPGRYIYGVRNGLDVAVSYHYHARTYLPGMGDTANDFFRRFMAGTVPYGSWFDHVTGWIRNRRRLNVLVVTYEELSTDLEGGIRRIADFCGIKIDPAAMPRILERCSFAFMKEHDARFSVSSRLLYKPANPETAFIRKGRVGGWREELDAESVREFHEACDRRLRRLGADMVRVLSGRGAGKGEPALTTPPAGGVSFARQPGDAARTGS